jgi:hypothetical protein
MLREEIKWYECAKVKELLEGDSNTMYFQLISNGKHRKTGIFSYNMMTKSLKVRRN